MHFDEGSAESSSAVIIDATVIEEPDDVRMTIGQEPGLRSRSECPFGFLSMLMLDHFDGIIMTGLAAADALYPQPRPRGLID